MKNRSAIIMTACLAASAVVNAGGIYGTGATSEDSIAVSVHITDSLGNPSWTHADSFFVCVLGPSGDSLTGIAGTASTTGLDIDSIQTGLAGWVYVYADAINDIDGTGRPGTYELTFCAKDISPEYMNCVRRTFQVATTNISSQLASITTVLDSVVAVLDTLQNQDDWVSSFDHAADTVVSEAASVSGNAAADMADSVWGHVLDAGWPQGSFGDSAAGWGATAAGDLDSGLVQRIVNRRLDSVQNAYVVDMSDASVDAVWDESQGGHTNSGTFGYYLDAPVSGIGSPFGDGVVPVAVAVRDTVADQPVPGVRITIHNESLETIIAQGATNSGGYRTFNLDVGRYIISSFAPGYVFTGQDTLDVTGPVADTVRGYSFDPGNPSAPNLCRVYGYIYGIDGQPVENVSISAELVGGVVLYGSMIVSPFRRNAVTDSSGYFYLDLIPSGDLDPSGTQYRIGATYPAGTIINRQVTVPDASNWLLTW